MVVSFGAEITGDLASAEAREWLITNGLGSYGCGTVAGSLTRAYHGLLVAALEEVVQVGIAPFPSPASAGPTGWWRRRGIPAQFDAMLPLAGIQEATELTAKKL